MPSPGSILRQLSGKEGWKSTSKRWVGNTNSFNYSYNNNHLYGGGAYNYSPCDNHNNNGFYTSGQHAKKKRVMVVVDHTSRSKHAVTWALTQVANEGDVLTLLQVTPISSSVSSDSSPSSPCNGGGDLASSLGSLCKAYKPGVEVEALVIRGPKLATVLSQVKKLEVSVLVLGQQKPSSPLINCLFGISSSEDFVEQCINNAECLTVGVRKQSKGMGGYLISTRSQKNFWLLA